MAYSNGYNNTSVLAALFGRLAWSTDSTLNSTNKTSASGRYFDDGSFHSLVTVANVKATAPAQSDWDAFFTQKQNAVISRCLNAVFNEPEYKEQTLLYERVDETEHIVTNSDKAVGYKIKMPKAFDLSVKLISLELYFDGEATFNVYLFKQGNNSPIKTRLVTTVANQKTTVALTDWILNSRESSQYYVVYFQDDLADVHAIQEQAYWAETKIFSADPFTSPATGGSAFNRINVSVNAVPYGINILAASFKDFTTNIVNQPHLFDEMLGLQMAYQVIEEMIYAIRSNASERIIKEQLDKVGLQLDLNGAAPISDSPQVVGLKQRIDREAKRLKAAFYPKPKAQTVNLC